MIVRFPFVADSRKTFRFDFMADNIPHFEDLDLNDIVMLIKAENGIEVHPFVYLLPDEIGMIIQAEDSVVIDNIDIGLDIYDTAMRIACNEAQTSISVNILENGSGNTRMVIKADEADTNLLIDATRTSLFKAWMALHINDLEWEYRIDALINEVNMKIRAKTDVDVGPISTNLDKLRAFMMLADSKDYVGLEDLEQGVLEQMGLSEYETKLADLHLEIGILKDEAGNAILMLRAVDDLKVIRGVPITLGMIDANKIGELDPDSVPDYTYL